jgi:mono/diheme cytochrome c family protein
MTTRTTLSASAAPAALRVATAACGFALVGAVCASHGDSKAEYAPTYSRDIAPILLNNCASCHRPGQVGPFSLLNYDDARQRAKQIADVTASRFMPPWLAEINDQVHFVGERRLTDEQIALIRRWADAGAPEGDPAALPEQRTFRNEWRLGRPDLVLKLADPLIVPAEGDQLLWTFALPTGLEQDVFVRAIELRPSNPRVVHHAAFLFDGTGLARQIDASHPGAGYPDMGTIGFNQAGSAGGWTPGSEIEPLPDGVARALRQGEDVVVELHLAATGKPEAEQFEVGLYFAKPQAGGGAPDPLETVSLGSFCIDIQPGDAEYRVTDEMIIPVDCSLFALTPHAHYVCQKIQAAAVLLDGTSVPLLTINDWDFNWKQRYDLKQQLLLPAGTKIVTTFVFDNSQGNPQNPHHPPRRVRTGHNVGGEMALLFLDLAPVNPADLAELQQAHFDKQQQRMEAAKECNRRP